MEVQQDLVGFMIKNRKREKGQLAGIIIEGRQNRTKQN